MDEKSGEPLVNRDVIPPISEGEPLVELMKRDPFENLFTP